MVKMLAEFRVNNLNLNITYLMNPLLFNNFIIWDGKSFVTHYYFYGVRT
jgi:hypothetical protein